MDLNQLTRNLLARVAIKGPPPVYFRSRLSCGTDGRAPSQKPESKTLGARMLKRASTRASTTAFGGLAENRPTDASRNNSREVDSTQTTEDSYRKQRQQLVLVDWVCRARTALISQLIRRMRQSGLQRPTVCSRRRAVRACWADRSLETISPSKRSLLLELVHQARATRPSGLIAQARA